MRSAPSTSFQVPPPAAVKTVQPASLSVQDYRNDEHIRRRAVTPPLGRLGA
ncbi:MAG TPA: hypothetical protein VF353_09800 [Candidatus Binatia bacterium]